MVQRSSSARSVSTLLIVLWFFLAPSLYAQASGKIEGTIVDTSGSIVQGATVTCKNADTALVRTTETNAAGIFAFPDLPIGQYTISVNKPGFKSLNTSPV